MQLVNLFDPHFWNPRFERLRTTREWRDPSCINSYTIASGEKVAIKGVGRKQIGVWGMGVWV